jgi:membrane-associated phospholipid phosphatase
VSIINFFIQKVIYIYAMYIQKILFTCCLSLILFTVSLSQDPVYKYSWRKDGGLLGASIGLLVGSYIYDRDLNTLNETQIGSLDSKNINGFDRGVVGNYSSSAQELSDAFLSGSLLLPMSLIIAKPIRNESVGLALLFTETLLVSGALSYTAKALSKRNRPFVYNPNVPLEEKMSKSAKHSFYSGHASLVSSISFFSAKVFSDYFVDSKWKPVVWTTAALVPTITGYLRMRAGKHFPTDVISGIIVGAGVGYFIPHLHKKERKVKLGFSSLSNGLSLSWELK